MLIPATEREKQVIENELLSHRKSGGVLDVVVIPENEDEQKSSSGFEVTTLLHVAAKYGNVEATQYLVDNGYDVDTTNPSGCTPLMIALHYDHVQTIKVLAGAKANICLCGKSAIREATCILRRDHYYALTIVDKMEIVFGLDTQAIAEQLLKHGVTLAKAVSLKNASILRYMLDGGCAVDERDSSLSGRTALHYAVHLGDPDMVNLLLDRGIDVNIADDSGKAPLRSYDYESEDTNKKLEVLRTLLNRGASNGTTITCLFVLGSRGTVRTILDYNNSLLAAGENGLSEMEFLLHNENEGVIEELKNWDIDMFDQVKAASLVLCGGSAKALEFLIEKGVIEKLHAQGHSVLTMMSMLTPKDAACKARYLKFAEIVLPHEDVQSVNEDGQTVFDYVLRFRNFYLANIVLAHLALREELGETITQIIIAKIDSNVRFKNYFKLCKQRLDEMKRTKICDSTTLFQFLTVDEKKMVTYARDPTVVSQLELIRHNQRLWTMYYYKLLRRRIDVVLKYLELKKQVALVIPENCQLRYNDYLIEMIANFIGV